MRGLYVVLLSSLVGRWRFAQPPLAALFTLNTSFGRNLFAIFVKINIRITLTVSPLCGGFLLSFLGPYLGESGVDGFRSFTLILDQLHPKRIRTKRINYSLTAVRHKYLMYLLSTYLNYVALPT